MPALWMMASMRSSEAMARWAKILMLDIEEMSSSQTEMVPLNPVRVSIFVLAFSPREGERTARMM